MGSIGSRANTAFFFMSKEKEKERKEVEKELKKIEFAKRYTVRVPSVEMEKLEKKEEMLIKILKGLKDAT